MRYAIKVKDLQVGMHVILPASWIAHPFLTDSFIIKSQDQIAKIKEYGFDEVFIDTAKGLAPSDTGSKSHIEMHMNPPRK